MNFEDQIPAFFEYIERIYKKEKKDTLNPISEFSDFLNERLTEGSLDRDFDDFTVEDFRREAKEHINSLQEYVKNKDFKWIDCSSPSRWIFHYQDSSKTNSFSVKTSNAPSEIDNILNKNITNITQEELDILRDHVEKLKSQSSENQKERKNEIANCSYMIANLTFQPSKTVKNAKDWSEAGDCYIEIDNEIAYECYKKSSNQYSILLMYKESAQSLDKATSLTNYKELLKSKDKVKIERLKKDLLDCQVQFDRAGLNESASKKFILLCNIRTSEQPIHTRLFYYFFNVSSKYGESPIRVLLTASIILILCTAIYTFFGIKSGVDEISKAPILEMDFWTSLYFSFVTFTTLGYGDYAPLGWVRLVATFQAISGLILTSLFMVTLVRKHSR